MTRSIESAEVRNARRAVTPLADESRAAIGSVATQLYNGLQDLRPAHHSPMNLPLGFTGYSGPGIQRGRLQLREAAVDSTCKPLHSITDPRRHPIEGYTDLTAVAAETSYLRSYYYTGSDVVASLAGGRHHIPLPNRPGYPRSVSLELHRQGYEDPSLPGLSATISTKGAAYVGTPGRAAEAGEYASPQALRNRHAADYRGRLAITGVVAEGVRSIYDISVDLTGVKALHAAWGTGTDQPTTATDVPFWAQHEVRPLNQFIQADGQAS